MINFSQIFVKLPEKMAIFRENGRTELRTNLTERSAEHVRSILAERSAEPFGFGRTLFAKALPNAPYPVMTRIMNPTLAQNQAYLTLIAECWRASFSSLKYFLFYQIDGNCLRV